MHKKRTEAEKNRDNDRGITALSNNIQFLIV